ncbi:unnamed protein product [Urochloa humidicola]
MAALSRRFLNLIVDNRTPGAKSLRCIDLMRQHFFERTPAQQSNGNGPDSQLVNLGSGRFCIARFFHTRTRSLKSYHYVEDHFTVFTGVDVVPNAHDSNVNGNGSGSDNSGNGSSGKVELGLIKYKSRIHLPNDSSVIKAVF